jgi:hypothetical protein
MPIHVSHFPPGTSKWNKIEHRMFCHITQNWRGRPLVSHEVVLNLIARTTTKAGLKVRAELDRRDYPTGIKVTDEQIKAVHIRPEAIHHSSVYPCTSVYIRVTQKSPQSLTARSCRSSR